jgi:transcriptional regulator with XRE-family HTH domain
MNWAKKIKELRYRESIKQDALAAQLGVSQASVSIWERGVSAPPHHVQETLRNLYGATPSERLLNAIRSSILHNPNPCALITLRDERPIIDTISDTGLFGKFDGNVDRLLGTLFGDQLEALFAQMLDSGLFSGAIATAKIVSVVIYEGRDLPVTIALAPYSLDQEHWFVRADLRILNKAEAEQMIDPAAPKITLIPTS